MVPKQITKSEILVWYGFHSIDEKIDSNIDWAGDTSISIYPFRVGPAMNHRMSQTKMRPNLTKILKSVGGLSWPME